MAVIFSNVLRIGIFVCGVVFCGSALARLGDDTDQITRLYGKPIKTPTEDEEGIITKIFHVKSFFILVEIQEGKSIAEAYGHVDDSPLFNKEINAFLEVNGAGKTWTEKPGPQKRWERSDGNAIATYMLLGGQPMLWIRTKTEEETSKTVPRAEAAKAQR